MRKIILIVLAILFFLTACSTSQYLEDTEQHYKTENAITTVKEAEIPLPFYRSQLNSAERALYDDFFGCVSTFGKSFDCNNATQAQLEKIFLYIKADNPQIIWTNSFIFVTHFAGKEIVGHSVEPEYTMTASEAVTKRLEINRVAAQILSSIDLKASDYDKAHHVYTYLIENTEYNESFTDQSMYSVLVNNKGVCAGFASAFNYLMTIAKIPCITVSGSLKQSNAIIKHAWNMIYLYGQWYHVDVTSGEGVTDSDINFDYLCCTTAFIEKTHIMDNPSILPDCNSEDFDFYRLNGLFVDKYSKASFTACLKKSLKLKRQALEVKFSSQKEYQKGLEDLLGSLSLFSALEEATGQKQNRLDYSEDADNLVLKVYLE